MEEKKTDYTVNIGVDTTAVEVAIKKVEQLCETLRETHELLRGITGEVSQT